MKTPKEFDYDLWTTESGECFVRVKATGETTAVSVEVMRTLRAEEKAMRRAREKDGASLLSTDEAEDDSSTGEWRADSVDYAEIAETRVLNEQIQRLLTEKQLDIYLSCMKGGMGIREYARLHGVKHQSVFETTETIRKKVKKFLS